MPRKQPRSLAASEREDLLDELWSMIAILETKEETRNFFRDLLSETESIMLARRIRIAKFLLEGKGYEEISERLQTGHSTIASVHRWLQSGFDGYKELIPRLEKKLRKKRGGYIPPQSEFERLRKKYPLHFLLFNLLDEKRRR